MTQDQPSPTANIRRLKQNENQDEENKEPVVANWYNENIKLSKYNPLQLQILSIKQELDALDQNMPT